MCGVRDITSETCEKASDSQRMSAPLEEATDGPEAATSPSELPSAPLLRGVGVRRLEERLQPGGGHRRNRSVDLRGEESTNFFSFDATRDVGLAVSGMDPSASPALSITSSAVPRKKLSESRNVNLPNIVMPPAIDTRRPRTSESGSRYSRAYSQTPPLTESPIGHSLHHELSGSVPRSAIETAVIDIRIYFSNTHVVLNPSMEEGIETESPGRFSALELRVEGGKAADAAFLLDLVAREYSIDPSAAEEALALWMESPLLEVQLKPHHSPYCIHRHWAELLAKFTSASPDDIIDDAPTLVVKRRVQLSLRSELEIINRHEDIREILFNDAHESFMSGRYPLDAHEGARLAGMAMAVIFERFNKEKHNLEFLRRELDHFLPAHLLSVVRGSLVFGKALSAMNSLEETLVKAWETAPSLTSDVHLQFLLAFHSQPFYGAAFFPGSIERLKKRRWPLQNSDIHVMVGVTQQYVCVLDGAKHDLLLVQRISDCSWKRIDLDERQLADGAEPSLLLHFPDDGSEDGETGGGRKRSASGRGEGRGKLRTLDTPPTNSKMLQIFGRQAVMVDALLTAMLELAEDDEAEDSGLEECEKDGIVMSISNGISIGSANGAFVPSSTENSCSPPTTLGSSPTRPVCRAPSLTRHSKLCLATFDPHGKCVGAHGSLKMVLQRHNVSAVG